jgi:hypothetical protein
MHRLKAWWIGFALIIFFILTSESTIIFKEYFFIRLGLNRNLVLTVLWSLPIFASFIAVSFSTYNRIIIGLSYILILSLLAPIAHFLVGQAGVAIDFGGLVSMRVTFTIYLVLSVITIGIGCVAGILFRKLVK